MSAPTEAVSAGATAAAGESTPEADRRFRWVCDGCGVSVRHVSGEVIPRPRGWADLTCVACHREAVRQSSDWRPIVKAELLRGARVSEVAQTAGVARTRVKMVEREMIVAGDLARDRPARHPADPRRAMKRLAEDTATLREMGEATAESFAARLGVVATTAARRLDSVCEAGHATKEHRGRRQFVWRSAD